MFGKIKLISQLLLLQLTAKSQRTPFEQMPFSNPLATEVDSIIHEQVRTFFKKAKAPGLIIGISQEGAKSYYSYGFADSVTKKEFTATTIFEAGSVTKTFTANLLLQLQQEGLIDIQNSILNYLPAIFAPDSILQKITLINILSHSSGLPVLPHNLDKVPGYTMMQPYQFYKKEHLYSFLKTIKKIKPGPYQYSNLGFGLLGTVEENVTGMSFESLLNQYILQPLQMNDTYTDTKKNSTDTATGYFYGKPADFWQFDCIAGAGTIKSTATDMLNYLDAHINNSNHNFSVAVYKTTQPVKLIAPEMQICYGWHTLENLKHRVFWHNGGTYGFSTFAAFEPQTKTSIVLAANSTGDNTALDKLAVDLLILLTGK